MTKTIADLLNASAVVETTEAPPASKKAGLGVPKKKSASRKKAAAMPVISPEAAATAINEIVSQVTLANPLSQKEPLTLSTVLPSDAEDKDMEEEYTWSELDEGMAAIFLALSKLVAKLGEPSVIRAQPALAAKHFQALHSRWLKDADKRDNQEREFAEDAVSDCIKLFERAKSARLPLTLLVSARLPNALDRSDEDLLRFEKTLRAALEASKKFEVSDNLVTYKLMARDIEVVIPAATTKTTTKVAAKGVAKKKAAKTASGKIVQKSGSPDGSAAVKGPSKPIKKVIGDKIKVSSNAYQFFLTDNKISALTIKKKVQLTAAQIRATAAKLVEKDGWLFKA